jgi:hypothetical protein
VTPLDGAGNVAERTEPSTPDRRIQSARELGARKSKENQEKRLAFPCFSLVESGLFNGLRGKK